MTLYRCGAVCAALAAVAAIAAIAARTAAAEETYMCDKVTAAKRPPAAPTYSDVCFSSRWKRPNSKEDTYDTFRDAAAFHATRLDWVYTEDTNWIREITDRGYVLSVGQNSWNFGDWREVGKGQMQDKNGKPVTAPWEVSWKAWHACVNSQDYRNRFLEKLTGLVETGVSGFQYDDWGYNYQDTEYGACFCPHCRELAAKSEVNLNDRSQMEEFQKKNTAEFYKWLTESIDKYAGRHVALSCNWFTGNKYQKGKHEFLFRQFFDFGIAELSSQDADPWRIQRILRETRAIKKAQVFTFVSQDVEHTRKVVALCYASGGHMIVPWDVYMGTGKPRYFGKPQEYADLYGFVRANAAYLDDYEEATVFLPKRPSTRSGGTHEPPGNSPFMVKGASQVCGFARTVPGNRNAPVVIHLVEWGTPAPSEVLLQPTGFLGGKPFKLRLLIPAPYDKAIHEEAERKVETMRKQGERRGAAQVSAYGALTMEVPVETRVDEKTMVVTLPPLKPWGLLVLEAERR